MDMVINKRNNNGRVKFISYDGECPNRCRGVLVLEIDGVQYKFGHHFSTCHYNKKLNNWVFEDEDPNNPNYEKFWETGGHASTTGGVSTGEWIIDANELDEKFRDLAYEIDKVFNENVPWGCCGGCL
jgi:hypothetical protein